MNVLVPFLVISIKKSKKWALVNVLKALSSTLYENGRFCLEVGCLTFLTIANVYLLHCIPTETEILIEHNTVFIFESTIMHQTLFLKGNFLK